ncbi:S-layer homology domain-containing protein [Paenibacillus hodogayensis]|uniref:S-layer homology domain-containing protein n=1 Tax=Paenibacillus hodogayensis TaxID=279208 RepID=A0ABV5W4T9_9BACL
MHVFRKMKRYAIALLIVCMTTSGWSAAFALEKPADIQGHWAERSMQAWLQQGYIQGYEDGSLRPNEAIKRGELLALINRLYDWKDAAAISYADLPDSHWAYADVAKAVKAGYVQGYEDNSIRVEANVTRQELAVIVARLLKLGSEESDRGATQFRDSATIADWSRKAVGTLAEHGIADGYEDGTFKPAGLVTRAEAIVMLERSNNANVYNKAGTYGPQSGSAAIKGNVFVTAPGVTLRNMKIDGNLTLGEGIGEGDVTLDNVSVTGKTFIRGGGVHSVYLRGVVLGQVIVDKKDGPVRIAASGTTVIAEVLVRSAVILEAEDATGDGIAKVTLAEELAKETQITLTGTFAAVHVLASGIMLEIPKGSVESLTVDRKGSGTKLVFGKEATIARLILHAAVSVFGQGTVQVAIINSAGIQFAITPGKLELGTDVDGNVTVKIGDKEISVSGGGGSFGGGSGPAGGSGGGDGSNPGGEPESGGNPAVPVASIPLEGSVVESVYTAGQRIATVGDVVYGVSDQPGTLYLVPGATSRYLSMLDIVVTEHKGLSKSVRANEKAVFSTAALPPGDYVLIGVTADYEMSEYRSDQELHLNAPLSASLAQESLYVYSNNGIVDIGFNKPISNSFATMAELRSSVSYATYAGTVTMVTYATNDRVELREHMLRIAFAAPPSGKVTVRVPAGVLKDYAGAPLSRAETVQIDFGPTLAVEQNAVKSGQALSVVTDRAAEVYLIKRGLSATKADLERGIQNGSVRKVQTEANVPASLATTGLPPGSYTVIAWGGKSSYIQIQ